MRGLIFLRTCAGFSRGLAPPADLRPLFPADLRPPLRYAAFGSYAGANDFQLGRPVARRFFGNWQSGLP